MVLSVSKCKLDKFYTKPEVVELALGMLEILPTDAVMEPSCGNGAFVKKLSHIGCSVVAYDIKPECPEGIEQDFLELLPYPCDVVVGNPPFGKNSSLAVEFFNYCAEFNPRNILFVLPKTFKKPRFWKRLSKKYVLDKQQDCPKNSFLASGDEKDVPCVIQLWKREERKDWLPSSLSLFKEVALGTKGAFFIRRAGGKAGTIVDNYTPSSTYCVTTDEYTRQQLDKYKEKINSFAGNTAGVKSITLLEIEDILLGRYLCDNFSCV